VKDEHQSDRKMNRRTFLASASAAGAGLAVAPANAGQPTAARTDDLQIAVIGVGAQGRILIDSILKIPGIRFKAICDIWSYGQQYGLNYLKKNGHDVKVYEDYRELLASEKDLDAVVVATPDWMHAEHSVACMEAGLHVYCEKEMSNSLEGAKKMVLAARQTGKLLQIGRQRRSNPRYIHAIDNLIRKEKLLGRMTQAYGQWNRPKSGDLGWPRKHEMSAAFLEKYGYPSMREFRNWRWYRKYGGGPVADLGSDQIDVFGWVFGIEPKSVMAAGGVDYYPHHEWYDNVMAIFEFENEHGVGRAMYQVLTTTGHGSFYEAFLGEDGSIDLSEVPERGNVARREAHADVGKWNQLARRGYLKKPRIPIQQGTTRNISIDVRETAPVGTWPLPIELLKPPHQPHLENFFEAVRTGEPLNCSAEEAYKAAVVAFKVNESVEAGRKLEFQPEDFKV
jgi:predicted dehydrogenase